MAPTDGAPPEGGGTQEGGAAAASGQPPPAAEAGGPATSGAEAAEPLPVPYEVLRAWPAEWDLLPLFRGELELLRPGPARFLHPALEVRSIPGRGRGVLTTRAVGAGELLVLDSPLILAASYDKLVEDARARTEADEALRRHVLSMCGDPADEAARAKLEQPLPEALLRNIVRHNYHLLEPVPKDGEPPSGDLPVGLWPLCSLVNHSLHPNVTRTFAGHCSCLRSIRPLGAGEEVLDNYLDLRFPASTRRDMMRRNHGIDDEGPDANDAPAAAVEDIMAAHKEIMEEVEVGTQEVTQEAFAGLVNLTNQCMEVGIMDPTFTNIFRDFALTAGQLGSAEMSLQGLAQAVEFATAREPYSVISYMLALRMAHMAHLAGDEVDDETRRGVGGLARRHFEMVFGRCPDAFEAVNPQVAPRLAASPPPSSSPQRPSSPPGEGREAELTAGAGAEEGRPKRSRTAE